jgi:hypothetical protein
MKNKNMNRKIIFWIICCFTTTLCRAQIQDAIRISGQDLKTNKEQVYDRISWQSDYMTNEEGKPELPYYKVSYVVPIDAVVEGITFRNTTKQLLKEKLYIQPAPTPVLTNSIQFDEPVQFNEDTKLYASDTPYPGKLYEIESDDFFHGYHIITFRIYPFEYIPKSRILNYYPNLEYTVEYASVKNANIVKPLAKSIWRAELGKNYVKRLVKNPEDVELFGSNVQKLTEGKNVIQANTGGFRSQTISVADEITPDYIIITSNALKASFQPLADWKTKKGIFTILVTTEEINAGYSGSDLREKIRNYLINAYGKWGTVYVLLGGDINIMPSINIKSTDPASSLSYPADMYYSAYYSSPWNPSGGNTFTVPAFSSQNNFKVILGRIPVSNTQEVTAYISKIMAYERANNIGDLNYLKNSLYSDAYMSVSSSGYLSNFGMSTIKNNASIYVSSWINNKFICDNANCVVNPAKYGGSCPGGDIELNRDNFLSCLNTGANLGVGKFHIIYHMDHCGPTTMGISNKDKGQNINRVDMDNLTNGTSYQIMMSAGCHPANFAYDCIGKHYLMKPNGGGVAFIGNTDSGWSNEYSQWLYFCDALYTTTNHPGIGRYDIGSAFQYVYVKGDHADKWRLHLLGDPEMQVWTNVPQTFNVTTSPTSIQTGARTLTVTVSGLSLPSGETALICVSKGTEVYETKTINGNGAYTIPVDAQTTGTLYVTVTAHNYKPVEKTVSVTTNTASNLFINSVNFVDNGTSSSVGNGNGQNDAGETVCLQVAIKNNGATTAAAGLIAKLSCNSDSVTVLSSTASLGNIASGSSTIVNFRYQIHKDMHETLSNSPNPVTFQLHIAGSGVSPRTKTFNIDVFAVDLKQRNKIITNSASSPFNLQIELQNTGKAPSSGLSGYLYFNNDSIAATFSSINSMETKLSNTFQIPLSLVSNPNFTLKVKNTFGKTWTSTFNLSKPNAVAGLKSSSKEHSVDLLWNAVSGASGYNIYRCNVGANDTESGNYVRLNTLPVTSRYFDDASGLNALTKYYYRVTSLSQTGMESSPARILAWTSYPNKGLYPVVMNVDGSSLESHWAAEDIDGDGNKEIFSALTGGDSGSEGSLIALDWEGKELFDIDNNVTTYSGFANLNIAIRAGVAIGDINRDGIKEIISLTRGFESTRANNSITCYIAQDLDSDHKPDIVWKKQTQRTFKSGAIIDNLDNSPDDSMEIVAMPCGNSTNKVPHTIEIYNAQGTLIQELSLGSATFAYSAAAVADLDGDGDKEIIAGLNGGVYIWHHNGDSFGATNPLYSLSGYRLGSSPVICDINNDGGKEILLSVFKESQPDSCRILAIKTNGQLLSGWGTSGSNSYKSTLNNDYTKGLTKEIAVGDLNGDGKLEVVAVGANCVKIWNNDGTLYNTITLSGLESQFRTPLLADIDGDFEIEIIVTSYAEGKIYGLKRNGSSVLGFPLETAQKLQDATPVIADLDNNGKLEIVAGTGSDKKIYVWETNGNPSRIEWGSVRHDARNTGEYAPLPCPETIIRSNTTWNSTRSICGDIIVKSGTLTINNNSNVSMDASSMILVMNGATLHIDSGNLLNSNVKILDGGNLIISNDGSIKKRNKGELNVMQGASFNFQSGTIE